MIKTPKGLYINSPVWSEAECGVKEKQRWVLAVPKLRDCPKEAKIVTKPKERKSIDYKSI